MRSVTSLVHVAVIALLILVLPRTASAQTFFGPTPYLSAGNIPSGFYAGGVPIFLENFEDLSLDGGITASSGQAARGQFADSVDADDGVIDGSGQAGSVWGHPSSASPTFIDFTFSGTLPTAAGLVWTDSIGGTVSFAAYGPGGQLLGQIGPFSLVQPGTTGQTAEDRFFGVHNAGGISRIRIIDTGRNFEVDHVQYGNAPAGVPPNAPLNLTATVIGNTVNLAWQAPLNGTVPSGYLVEAALSTGGAAIASLPVAATSLAAANVPNGVYYLRVRSLSAAGISGPSNEVIVSVPEASGCTTAPNAPTNFAATASGNQVVLTWSAAVGGCAATGYVVQAGSAPGLTNIASVNVGGITSLSAFALSGTYYIRVLALNSFGISSPTAEVVLTVGATLSTRVSDAVRPAR
jgi:hypothetical protein